MKPYLSLVIPYYNAPEKLERLLASIAKSKHAPPYEVIVVDDGSDKRAKLSTGPAAGFLPRKPTRGPLLGSPSTRVTPRVLHIVTLKHNRGPAIARNRGVDAARGKFIVFLDCDVEVFPDTLANIAKIYQDDPDIVALTGVWVKEQRSHDFFPNFKALRDWSYWIHERDKSGYYFLFSTRIASIKKAVFLRLGGFDETYPAPLVEDIELTYRIARRYAIIFAPQVRVRHEFGGFAAIAQKYFWRTYYWAKLYSERKKFDPVATTVWESLTAITGVGSMGILILVFLSYLGNLGNLGYLWGVWLAFAIVHLLLVRKFLWFAYQEKGLAFALKALGAGLILYMVIIAGAFYYKLRKSVTGAT